MSIVIEDNRVLTKRVVPTKYSVLLDVKHNEADPEYAEDRVVIHYSELDTMIVVLTALSVAKQKNINMENGKLFRNADDIFTEFDGYYVRLCSMNGERHFDDKFLSEFSESEVEVFPPLAKEPDPEPVLSFDDLHPKRPTGYEGRAY